MCMRQDVNLIRQQQYRQWLYGIKLYLARILKNLKYLNKRECVEPSYRPERTQQRLVKRSMFNYGVVIQLKFGDFESETAIKFTLLKA